MTDAHEPDHAAALPGPWVRALLPTAVLACVTGGPLHGYGIAQALGGLGFGVPKGGSLYPALARLEEDGALEAAWVPGPSGPARREYTLTARGLDRLARERALMQSFLARTGLSSIEAEVSAPAAPVAAAGARQEGGTSGR